MRFRMPPNSNFILKLGKYSLFFFLRFDLIVLCFAETIVRHFNGAYFFPYMLDYWNSESRQAI